MEDEGRVAGEPLPNFRMLVGGVLVEDDVHDLSGGHLRFHSIEEAGELRPARPCTGPSRRRTETWSDATGTQPDLEGWPHKQRRPGAELGHMGVGLCSLSNEGLRFARSSVIDRDLMTGFVLLDAHSVDAVRGSTRPRLVLHHVASFSPVTHCTQTILAIFDFFSNFWRARAGRRVKFFQ